MLPRGGAGRGQVPGGAPPPASRGRSPRSVVPVRPKEIRRGVGEEGGRVLALGKGTPGFPGSPQICPSPGDASCQGLEKEVVAPCWSQLCARRPGSGLGSGDALPGHRSAVSASRSPSGGARPGGGMVLGARWARRGAAPDARPARPAAPGSSPVRLRSGAGHGWLPGRRSSPDAGGRRGRRFLGGACARSPGLRRARRGAGAARAQRPAHSLAARHLARVARPPPPPRLLRPSARPIPGAPPPPPLPAPAAGRPRASERVSERAGGRREEAGGGRREGPRPGEGPPPRAGPGRPPGRDCGTCAPQRPRGRAPGCGSLGSPAEKAGRWRGQGPQERWPSSPGRPAVGAEAGVPRSRGEGGGGRGVSSGGAATSRGQVSAGDRDCEAERRVELSGYIWPSLAVPGRGRQGWPPGVRGDLRSFH